MFCPKCGKAEQQPETYCRQCGVFLPDLSKPLKRESPPEENLKANTVLSLMTVICCFVLAALLYALLGFRENTPVMIYITAGFLIAMGCWHIQTFIRTRKLKKQWQRRTPATEIETILPVSQPASTAKLLDTPDFRDAVPASVTESTTKHLNAKLRR